MSQNKYGSLICLILSLALITESFGQHNSHVESIGFTKPEISINPTYGFVFNERFDTEFGNVLLNQSQCYGVSVGYRPSSWKQFELGWRHQVSLTEGDIFYYNGFNRLVEEQVEGNVAIEVKYNPFRK